MRTPAYTLPKHGVLLYWMGRCPVRPAPTSWSSCLSSGTSPFTVSPNYPNGLLAAMNIPILKSHSSAALQRTSRQCPMQPCGITRAPIQLPNNCELELVCPQPTERIGHSLQLTPTTSVDRYY